MARDARTRTPDAPAGAQVLRTVLRLKMRMLPLLVIFARGARCDGCFNLWLESVATLETEDHQNEFHCCPQYTGLERGQPDNAGGNGTRKALLFLHVGKTGGTSVASWLSKMNIPAVHVHVHPLLPSVAQRLGNRVVISVRDPIERVLSAFNYERARNKSFWRPMDDCFASLNDLVEQAFLTTRSTPACRKMARAVPPNGWSRASGHLGLGFCHYLSGAMPLLRHNRVWLVRQETMAADLGGLARWLGLHNSTALRLPIPKLNPQEGPAVERRRSAAPEGRHVVAGVRSAGQARAAGRKRQAEHRHNSTAGPGRGALRAHCLVVAEVEVGRVHGRVVCGVACCDNYDSVCYVTCVVVRESL